MCLTFDFGLFVCRSEHERFAKLNIFRTSSDRNWIVYGEENFIAATDRCEVYFPFLFLSSTILLLLSLFVRCTTFRRMILLSYQEFCDRTRLRTYTYRTIGACWCYWHKWSNFPLFAVLCQSRCVFFFSVPFIWRSLCIFSITFTLTGRETESIAIRKMCVLIWNTCVGGFCLYVCLCVFGELYFVWICFGIIGHSSRAHLHLKIRSIHNTLNLKSELYEKINYFF